MKLYGSTTSPFVRRIRLWLGSTDYEFVNLDIFAGPGREVLKEKNPTLKVPMLEDGEQMVFDSRVIFRYLQHKLNQPAITWDQENQLTLIDSANDSLVQLMILKRSGIARDDELLYFKLQYERMGTLLSELESQVSSGAFNYWNYPAICLYSLVDWASFRELVDFTEYPAIVGFWQQHQSTDFVAQTDPRV